MTLRMDRLCGLLVVLVLAVSDAARAAVVEYYNPDLNNYFITADPVEQRFVDTGAVGRWQRTDRILTSIPPIRSSARN